MKTPETKYTPIPGTLDEPNRLHGYAARFNEQSALLHDKTVCKTPFVEVIAPGAFTRTLQENGDIRSLYNHDRGAVLGRTKAGTLALSEDDQGLHFVNFLPDTQVARDLRVSLGRGDIDGCSFSGYVVRDKVELGGPGEPALRTIYEIKLTEITPATAFPAYLGTTVALRSHQPEPSETQASGYPLNLARARLSLARD